MKASLSVIVLLATCSSLVSCQSLQQCQESCIQKIPNEQICNETCVQLQNVSSEANHTVPTVLPPPVPDPPRLLTSKYFKFTLEWNDYRATKYNTTVPIRYVLEVTRHKNISDPTVILPFIEKYHVVENSTFTIPQILVTKTNFSFRLAVVAFHGTSNFSAQSPLYTTNNSCEKTAHQTNSSRFNPCPVFNLHLVYTVTPVRHAKPNISTTLYWHHPEDILEVEHGFLVLDIVLSTRFHIPQRCHQDGLLGIIGHSDHVDLSQEPNRTSTVLSPTKQLYFGCHYEAKVHSAVEKGEKYYTTFYIPRCFQGFCGCEKPSSGKVSDLIHVEISSGNSTNRTVANMTWDVQAWDKEAAYFRTVSYCIGCPRPAVVRYVDSSGNKTTYSESYKDLWRGIKYRVNVFAFDQYSCQIGPEIHAFFDAVVPPTVAPTSTPSPSTPSPSTPSPSTPSPSTPSPSTPSPSTPSPSTPSPSTQTPTTMVVIPVETSTAPVSTDGTVGSTAEQGLSSATVAAITVPIVLLLFVALAVALCFFYRLKHKPTPLIRAPTGLRRLTDHQDDNVYHRNIRNDSSSAYANEFDRSGLVVNLPAKSEVGLELNPAYVEQRISDAIETGEADEFEVGYHRLEFKQILGKGAFGKVFLAEAYGIGGTPSESLVAVKVLNERADQDEVEDFKMEIEFMKTIGRHDNVLTMLGCCTLYPPLCLVIEYVPHGDLLHYLRDLRKTFERQMNYKPLKDDRKIEPEKPNTSSTLSQESAGPGNFSNRLLVPSVSDTRKNGVKRSHSAASLKSLKNATAMLAARRSSEIPSVHYVDRGPTDVSNTTQMTLVQDSLSVLKAKSLPATPVRSLDGALDSTDLQSFAYQIANGMAYLSERGLVHRDLAARNILVGDEKVLKISDFGLSREGVYVKRSTGKIPLRWLSIEAMRDRIYSTTSDIWAFGIVLWEICTLGGFPYPTLNDRDLLNFLVDEKRMDKPDNCTDEIYHIMLACWSRECEDRPSFQTLRDQLHGLQKEEQPYVNVDPSQDFNLPPTAARDTDGNLISFSDGALSNDMETADQDEDQWKAHLKQSNSDIESDISGINNLSSSRDVENAGYESSTDPEDLTFTANIQTLSPRQPSLSLEDETAESLV